jgi:hypothetical protein
MTFKPRIVFGNFNILNAAGDIGNRSVAIPVKILIVVNGIDEITSIMNHPENQVFNIKFKSLTKLP